MAYGRIVGLFGSIKGTLDFQGHSFKVVNNQHDTVVHFSPTAFRCMKAILELVETFMKQLSFAK